MTEITEKRKSKRVLIGCDLHFKVPGTEEFYEAWCINLSSSGISFVSDDPIQIGNIIEAHIYPEPPVMFATKLTIKVVRCEPKDNAYEIGARIEGVF